MGDFYLRTRCRMCDSGNLEKVMALTPTPPGNNFLEQVEVVIPEPTYPLDLYFCRECHHLQLGHVVDPKILYQKDYPYVSATSSRFVEHLRNYTVDMVHRFALKPGALVVDIGSNDGTCLRFFQEAGMKVLGVDPANEIARRATESGIETIGDFFPMNLPCVCANNMGLPHLSLLTMHAPTSITWMTWSAEFDIGFLTMACSYWKSAICWMSLKIPGSIPFIMSIWIITPLLPSKSCLDGLVWRRLEFNVSARRVALFVLSRREPMVPERMTVPWPL